MKRCISCGKTDTIREVHDRYVNSFELTDGTVLKFVIDDFPQRACSSCGERYFHAGALADADKAMTRELIARQIRDPATFRWLRKVVGLKATDLAQLLDQA